MARWVMVERDGTPECAASLQTTMTGHARMTAEEI